MKKGENKQKFVNSKKNFWIGVFIVLLLIAAVLTALKTQSPYSVGMGVLIGFLVSFFANKLKN